MRRRLFLTATATAASTAVGPTPTAGAAPVFTSSGVELRRRGRLVGTIGGGPVTAAGAARLCNRGLGLLPADSSPLAGRFAVTGRRITRSSVPVGIARTAADAASVVGLLNAAELPTAPTSVQAAGGTGHATLTWARPRHPGTSALTHYRISWTGRPGHGSRLAPAAGHTAQVALPPGRYQLTVAAVNAAGTGPTAHPPHAVAVASTDPPVRFAHDVVVTFDTPVPRGSWPGDGTAPAAYPRFLTYPDGTSGKYFPSQVLSVHDGVLDYYDHDGKAAAVLPFGYTGFRYGTYSVTMACQHYAGFHNAFLMWPNRGRWPAAGEYDFPESDTDAPSPYLAVVQDTHPVTFLPRTLTHCPRSWHDQRFHTYTQQWGPGFLRCYQDGILVGTVTANIQTQAMHPVLQNEWAPQNTRPDPDRRGHTYISRITYDASPTLPPAHFS